MQSMAKFEKNDDENGNKDVKETDESPHSYLIVDCLASTGHLVKQYIVKVKTINST